MSASGGYGPTTALTLPGMVLGGLLASIPAAAAGAWWFVGDAAHLTGRGQDGQRMEQLHEDRVRRYDRYGLGGWMVVFGMLVGMLFAANMATVDSWSTFVHSLVDRIDPGLGSSQQLAVAAMLQAFPFSVVGLFAWSLLTPWIPARLNRWPGSDRWIPWRAMAMGAIVWLACVLVAVLPTYLRLP